eukprot:CAMPEP_0202861094 /NCGR_PEP_ID=MMETSP1391-20130828/2609_1 /ASSEMBLY_ACC=CAM_ASM_000867 /TAXON_ID=1034604 /ORGANISM="Chlamydomonas leiostraca, Strain SAG 11-49" /LENGTH=366 /DNA_ID=CAMNT_0049540419 /DNA_START=27 /DNA_END=1123 /DNA_ORIENTATION=+
MLTTSRLDPSLLPPAGKRLVHDSGHEDYRYVLSHRQPSPAKKLQTTQWAGPSDTYLARKPEPLTPPAPKPPALIKPDHFSLGDIPAASPSAFPGLTLTLPSPTRVGGGTWSEPPSPLAGRQPGAAAATGARGPPSPPRATNPLRPEYHWPTGHGEGRPYPVAAAEPGEWRRRSPTRSLNLDTAALEGAHVKPATRTRKDPAYPTLDYSDVCGPLSPLRARLVREGREQLPAHDPRRLGMWGTSGDTGHMLHAHRAPTDPLSPVYRVHGRVVADDPPRRAAGPAASTPHTTAASSAAATTTITTTSHASYAAAVHKPGPHPHIQASAGAVSLAEVMAGMGRASNQNQRSPARRGHAGNMRELHARKP